MSKSLVFLLFLCAFVLVNAKRNSDKCKAGATGGTPTEENDTLRLPGFCTGDKGSPQCKQHCQKECGFDFGLCSYGTSADKNTCFCTNNPTTIK
uniref:Putative secreted salivary protein n=1 Tax=Xenopsylla cheopis TaxID=163159 RepID=A2IAD4_XENCH|nr:putative secreted salivary protein [Xenopsylla cheopis]